jgi:hypothetical protein
MTEKDIQVFRGFKSASFDFSAGYFYTYNYQGPMPGGGLKPAALACAKVTGNTLSNIFVSSGG